MTTSRERVLATLKHEEPDMIPFDLGTTVVTGITRGAYINLAKHMRLGHLADTLELYDTAQQVAVVDEAIFDKLGIDSDVRGLIPNFGRKNPRVTLEGDTEVFFEEWGFKRVRPKDSLYFGLAPERPFSREEVTVADIEKHPCPDPTDPKLFEGLKEKARQYHEKGGYAIILESVCAGILEMAGRMRGEDKLYMDFALNPDLAGALLEKFTQLKIQFYEAAARELGECAKYVQFIRESDDIAGQDGLTFSLDTYTELIKPRHQRLFEAQKKYFDHDDFYTFFHSDGALYNEDPAQNLFPHFIDTGVQVLNPLQLSAGGMDAETLKREYGKDLTFWGGIDTQSVLSVATPEQVMQNVGQIVNCFAPEGGYIFGTVHNIQDDVEPGNILAMANRFRELREY